jgi:hypothetical protein
MSLLEKIKPKVAFIAFAHDSIDFGQVTSDLNATALPRFSRID